MRALVLVVALAMSVPAAARAQATASPTTDELIRLDREWQEAVVKGDAEFIETRTAGSFRFTHGGGTRSDTKADWLRITRNVPQRFLERRASEQSVELHGDVALVFGRLDVRMAGAGNAGPSCYSLEYVHVYAREDGRWSFLSHRTMRGIDAAHPCDPK